ncbi:MAG TPA: hypothetical protein DDZ76_02540, partial [Xanthomonadales bacterium]|nr:hypothetical protein [Xanthomonadales bacterium]
ALADGRSLTLRLPAGGAHERLFFDVPPTASQVSFSLDGAGDYDLFVARAGEGPGSDASIAAAPPRDQAQRQVIGAAASKTITLAGGDLLPGRWYVTPVARNGGQPVQVRARIDAQSAPVRRFSHYFNPDRSGHGLLLDEAGGGSTWIAVWYTYLADGRPTWYLLAAPAPAATAGQWTSPMLRVAWDGTVGHVTEVGEATLTFTGATGDGLSSLTFSYRLDGVTGSERMLELTA